LRKTLEELLYKNRTGGKFSKSLESEIKAEMERVRVLYQKTIKGDNAPKTEAKPKPKPVEKPKAKVTSFVPEKAKKPKNTFEKTVENLLYQKFVDKGTSHPNVTGIFYNGGTVIATDAHVLAIVKMNYPKANEGKIIDKKGNVIDAKYPNYKAILPDLDKDYRKIDNPKFKEVERRTDLYELNTGFFSKKYVDAIQQLFAKFKETPTIYLPTTNPQKPTIFKSKTVYALLMPTAK